MTESDEKLHSSPKWLSGLDRVFWTPPWLRWNPDGNNHDLTWGQNIIFGFTAAFGVANLYYNHPILNVLADDFKVTGERAALIPTIMQAGYAGGLLFIVPLGDIMRRRPMVLGLMLATAVIWIGLTLTRSFSVFLGFSFLVGILTVTPQLMFPLAIQYAPQRHRATMTSIVMSGVVFGMLIARLLAGIITQYTSWRNVYWMSFGLQILILLLLTATMPDYPILRPDTSYLRSLFSILSLPFKKPVLAQHGFIAFFIMAMFTSFWTTLTFQLAAPPFNLSTLAIGLFALIGISPVFLNPVISRLLTSKLHPTGTSLIAGLVALAAVCVGTFVGTFSLAGLVIWAFLGDLGMNTLVVANRMAIAGVDPKAQNAVNSVYMVLTFCGQLFGTAVGNMLYARGGWVHSGALSIGMVGAALLLMLVKGPHEKGWVGWRGGWDLKDKTIGETARSGNDVETGAEPGTQEVEGMSGRDSSLGDQLGENSGETKAKDTVDTAQT
ncbi:major facilitator superfamily domain-containing protein [Pseudomassariella vexata]|uniref:Major facilitator superfamily domain-containing protein n=1 Tax=Pseudomassariella vexata TaxID=1141098 RepID=A0A1Y2DTX2_9PEZI|nr:major facilitator superfamily domain-containing protein [Pseudomassariella vexata]ORY62586.1 major facilitator superfamily domain-containing protein [Pseudomassariella vexata]